MGRLTRGIPGSAAAGGGITAGEHEDLDTLVHNLAESNFTELTYTGKDLTTSITWQTAAKIIKVRESAFTYTLKNLTGVVTQQYDGVGALLVTLTKTLAYTGKVLDDVTTVRT